MKLVTLLWTSFLCFAAQAGTIENVALRSTDAFSKCAAEKANSEIIKSSAKVSPIMGVIESEENPAKLASLRFYVSDSNLPNKLFKLMFLSSDVTDGWQMTQGSDGEIYAFSKAVESIAEVTTGEGTSLGHLDLTSCK